MIPIRLTAADLYPGLMTPVARVAFDAMYARPAATDPHRLLLLLGLECDADLLPDLAAAGTQEARALLVAWLDARLLTDHGALLHEPDLI